MTETQKGRETQSTYMKQEAGQKRERAENSNGDSRVGKRKESEEKRALGCFGDCVVLLVCL